MPTVAEQLHAAREAQKLTVQKVADATKIRTDHIRALEVGNYNVFSAPVYIRGSVKNYAALLKLDVSQIMASLETELNKSEKFSEPPPLGEESNTLLDRLLYLLSKLNWKVGVAIGAVLIVVVVVWIISAVMRHQQSKDPLAGLQPAVYQPANSGDTLPLPKK
ncbi:MAG: helix-turn-helix transcriptional regulator [Limisphaerales bacterium]